MIEELHARIDLGRASGQIETQRDLCLLGIPLDRGATTLQRGTSNMG
jgi:hypothetical protein